MCGRVDAIKSIPELYFSIQVGGYMQVGDSSEPELPHVCQGCAQILEPIQKEQEATCRAALKSVMEKHRASKQTLVPIDSNKVN